MGERLLRCGGPKAENSRLPDPPFPLGLQLDKVQRVLEGEGERGKGEEMKGGQLSLQLGSLR